MEKNFEYKQSQQLYTIDTVENREDMQNLSFDSRPKTNQSLSMFDNTTLVFLTSVRYIGWSLYFSNLFYSMKIRRKAFK